MKGKVCVLTYGKLTPILKKEMEIFREKADIYELEVLMDYEKTLPSEVTMADVIVSSGYNAEVLKSKTDKPVLVISASITDILCCIEEAQEYDSAPLIVTFGKKDPVLERLSPLISSPFYLESFNTPDDLQGIMEKHLTRGGRCVIGTALACLHAEANGLIPIYLHPRESVRAHLQLAVDTANSLHREAKKNQQVASIVEHSTQGILLAGQNGLVEICNPAAAEVLDLNLQEIVGSNVFELFPIDELKDVNSIERTLLNKVYTDEFKQLILNIIPIRIKGELASLLISITSASSIKAAERKIIHSLKKSGFVAKHHFSEYRSLSPRFQAIIKKAEHFSLLDEVVVIRGETGTGKELFAQSIHNSSRRSNAPFVPINCSALSESLLESELFGYDEGAFTGAKKGGKEGVFELAKHGTIFLDEISEISMAIQTKLLRVIQEKQIMRVGGVKLTNIDARIIVATNKDLWSMVQNGTFREDLYYRLNVLELHLPPLRDRPEDIVPLFFTFYARRYPDSVNIFRNQEKELNRILCSYNWPGNIRELENFVLMLCAIISYDDSSSRILEITEELITERRNKHTPASDIPIVKSKMEGEKKPDLDMILKAIEKYGGNQTLAAEALGISRVTLWRKLKIARTDSE